MPFSSSLQLCLCCSAVPEQELRINHLVRSFRRLDSMPQFLRVESAQLIAPFLETREKYSLFLKSRSEGGTEGAKVEEFRSLFFRYGGLF